MMELDHTQEHGGEEQDTHEKGKEEREHQAYWRAVHQALGRDEHGVLRSDEEIASELTRLMQEDEPLAPWESRRKTALMRALKEM